MVTFFLDRGANIEMGTKHGTRPLQLASWVNSDDIARLLLDRGAQIDAVDDSFRTALQLAAQRGRKSVVRLLLDRGAQTDVADENGKTALYVAAALGHCGMTRMLLEAEARWDVVEKHCGYTPLNIAARSGHKDAMQLLVDQGANIDVVLEDLCSILSENVEEWMNRPDWNNWRLRRLSTLTTIHWLLEQAASARAKETETKTLLNQVVWNDETAIADLVHDYSLNVENGFAERKAILAKFERYDARSKLHYQRRDKKVKNFERRVARKYELIFQLLSENGIDVEELEWKKYGVVVPISWLFGEEE